MQSSAAYLLFYRRRSDKPVGPPPLQELVQKFRDPTQSDSATDDADEDMSGEDKLGGPISLLHGSPSGSAGAEAGAMIIHSTAGGTGASAGTHPIPSQMTMSADDAVLYGPHQRLAPPTYEHEPSWSFDTLNNESAAADDNAEMNDVDSTLGEMGDHDHDFNDVTPEFESHETLFTETPGHTTPQSDGDNDYNMDSDALHVEDSEYDPPPTDIHLED